jgi:MFS family permease
MAQYFAPEGNGALFAQMIMAVPALMIILAAAAAGYLAERVGRRAVLSWALLVYAVAGLAGLWAPNGAILVAFRLVLGFAAGAIMTISLSLVADFPAGAVRDRVLGFASAGAAAMAVVALTLGGLLVDSFGWRGPFVLYALSLPVFAVALKAVPRGTHRGAPRSTPRPRMMSALWPVYLLTLVLTIGLFMPGIQGPFLLQAKGVANAATQGMILASYSLTAALVAACYGPLARVLAMPARVALASCGLGLGGLAMAVGEGPAALAFGCIVTGAGAGLVEPVTVSMGLQRAPAAVHTRAIGLLLGAVFLGQFINPLALNPLRATLGIQGVFIVVGTFFVSLGVVASATAIRRRANPGSPTLWARPQSTSQ